MIFCHVYLDFPISQNPCESQEQSKQQTKQCTTCLELSSELKSPVEKHVRSVRNTMIYMFCEVSRQKRSDRNRKKLKTNHKVWFDWLNSNDCRTSRGKRLRLRKDSLPSKGVNTCASCVVGGWSKGSNNKVCQPSFSPCCISVGGGDGPEVSQNCSRVNANNCCMASYDCCVFTPTRDTKSAVFRRK